MMEETGAVDFVALYILLGLLVVFAIGILGVLITIAKESEE